MILAYMFSFPTPSLQWGARLLTLGPLVNVIALGPQLEKATSGIWTRKGNKSYFEQANQ